MYSPLEYIHDLLLLCKKFEQLRIIILLKRKEKLLDSILPYLSSDVNKGRSSVMRSFLHVGQTNES